jgi:hypothetical protein
MENLIATPLRAPGRGGRSVTILVARDLLNMNIEDDPHMARQLVEDIIKRDEYGYAKYGQNLETHDGRPTIMDVYQELLDGVQYMRKLIEEGNLPGGEMAHVYPSLLELVRIVRSAINNLEGMEDALDWQKPQGQEPQGPDAGNSIVNAHGSQEHCVNILTKL